MNEREPQLEDYGITRAEYDLYKGIDPHPPWGLWLLGYLVAFVACFLLYYLLDPERELMVALRWTLFWHIPPLCLVLLIPIALVAMLVNIPVSKYRRSRLEGAGVTSRIEEYRSARGAYFHALDESERAIREAERTRRQAERARQDAERERRRRQAQYWMNLSGEEFEREVAVLLQRRGYRGVQLTGRSGDGGIDIRARRRRKSLIVQCKRYQKPVGPSVVRELLGSLVDAKADRALLFCTGGFTQGARQFAKGKSITLLDVDDIVRVAERIQQ